METVILFLKGLTSLWLHKYNYVFSDKNKQLTEREKKAKQKNKIKVEKENPPQFLFHFVGSLAIYAWVANSEQVFTL